MSILNTLAKNSTYLLTDDLKSGIMLRFTLEKGDEEAFDFLGYRYEDMGLINDNMKFVFNANDDDFEATPYPHTYEVDASAILLAYHSEDNGFSSLYERVKNQFSDFVTDLLNNDSNSVLNTISDDCSLENDDCNDDDDQDEEE